MLRKEAAATKIKRNETPDDAFLVGQMCSLDDLVMFSSATEVTEEREMTSKVDGFGCF